MFTAQCSRPNVHGPMFTAQCSRPNVHGPSPEGVGSEKYDATSASMVALLKYGSGLPFHRLERDANTDAPNRLTNRSNPIRGEALSGIDMLECDRVDRRSLKRRLQLHQEIFKRCQIVELQPWPTRRREIDIGSASRFQENPRCRSEIGRASCRERV